MKDKTGLDLPEGYFWYDKSIIKAFDSDGNVHKCYRLTINDDLTMSYSVPKGYDSASNFDLVDWYQLLDMHKERIEKLEEDSLNLIRAKLEKFKGYIPLIPTSTGKDSTVTLYLTRKVVPEAQAVFNNTTLDCADTYRMAKQIPNCIMMNPKQGFYQYIKEQNIVFNRISRGCCRIFKVGEMVNQLDHDIKYLMFMGMRNQESSTRSGYEDEWINITEWGKTSWQGILPIRKWTELDIWLYIFLRNIEVNPKYKKGYSRAGCAIACSFATKSTWVLDKYFYPIMRKRWEDILREDFVSNEKWTVINSTVDEYINQAWNGGAFRKEPTQEVIDEFAKYKGIDSKLAEQYFQKYCANGCKSCSGKQRKIKDTTLIAMNLKLHGRNVSKFYCKKCLMKMHNMTEEDYQNQVNEFKKQGCDLF